MNKMELTRLQRNFEFCLKEIYNLEQSKTSQATMYALVIGILGTAFMAGSVFAITAQTPRIILSIILAIPAIAGWVLPYFLYHNIVRKRTQKVAALIEEKQDEIYEICEKGNKLLN
jgi:phosphate/sulfate permease